MKKQSSPILMVSVAALSLAASPAHAQLEKLQNREAPVMHHRVITSAETEKELLDRQKTAHEDKAEAQAEKTQEESPPPPAEKSPQPGQEDKTADDSEKPADTPLTPTKDLKPWEGLAALFTATGESKKTARALAAFNAEPERVSPLGLFQTARLYTEQGDMKLASRYYYAAQLRARFDYFRWPSKGAGANNPYIDLSRMSEDVGKKVGVWAVDSSKRLAEILADVKAWDEKTPYAYDPGYKIPEDAVPEEKWPDLLTQTRQQFFVDSAQIVGALKAMKK